MEVKLNIGAGRNTKPDFINIDFYERENPLDLVIDITKRFPFESNSVDFIYAEQFIEHLSWLEGKKFLNNCFNVLKKGSILRLVLPHYKKIFQKYIDQDYDFFEVFFKELNGSDYDYYSRVYKNPEVVREERKENLPPEWHLSSNKEERERLRLRVRQFKYFIDVVHYFTHQFGEHLTLYDYESLRGILREIGFSSVIETEIKDIDSHASTRVSSSIYINTIK